MPNEQNLVPYQLSLIHIYLDDEDALDELPL